MNSIEREVPQKSVKEVEKARQEVIRVFVREMKGARPNVVQVLTESAVGYVKKTIALDKRPKG